MHKYWTATRSYKHTIKKKIEQQHLSSAIKLQDCNKSSDLIEDNNTINDIENICPSSLSASSISTAPSTSTAAECDGNRKNIIDLYL